MDKDLMFGEGSGAMVAAFNPSKVIQSLFERI